MARLFHGENHLESYGAKKDFPLGGKRVIGTPAHYAYLKIAEAATTAATTAPSRASAARCTAAIWPTACRSRWLAGEA